jgi:hypothetical protein
MLKIFVLFWFMVTAQGNQTQEVSFTSQEACEAAGDEMNTISEQMKKDGQISNFGGNCWQVENPAEGSI